MTLNPIRLHTLREVRGRLRTEAQMSCPCEITRQVEVPVDAGALGGGWVARECLDCGYIQCGRYLRTLDRPDVDH